MVLSGDLLSVMWRRDDGAIVLVCLCGVVLMGCWWGWKEVAWNVGM